jgi:hypothetical protein
MTTHRAGWLALIGLCVVYAGIYAWFYPPISGIEDEIGFVNQALVWSRGAISSEGAGFAEVTDFGLPGARPHLVDFVAVGDRHYPGRHPGRSLLLLPFLLAGGIRAGFVSGLLIHLATTLIAARLLVRLGRSPVGAALVLFHPTLALYTRTIMGDEAAGGFLLLAALKAMVPGRRGAIGAGLAVGFAALMRYHAGLALPVVAASIALDSARDRRRGDGLACLVAGGFFGLLLVVYNVTLYHAVLDPVGGPRGQFGLRYVPGNLSFYFVALMAFWPAMLFAPWLDRSPLGSLTRGVAGIFLAFFSAYYFHDRASTPVETMIVGLRLMQVALPIWIVSYAVVVSDRLVVPFRMRFGLRATVAVGAIAAGTFVVGTGLVFSKHQNHLMTLKADRDAIVAQVPPGSVVVTHGAAYKLFGIPVGGPVYRWLMLSADDTVFDHSTVIDQLHEPWFLATLVKGGGGLPEPALALVNRYGMRQVEPMPSGLILYRADPPTRTGR